MESTAKKERKRKSDEYDYRLKKRQDETDYLFWNDTDVDEEEF